ncbi:MAG: hypothetical protein GXY76_04155 [Chloroflexi bacterium]|nr:hypothetical protein [Chloroflexota bacterium]
MRSAIEEGYAAGPPPARAPEEAAAAPPEPLPRRELPPDFVQRMAQRHGVGAETARLWEAALGELALQLPAATHQRYLAGHTALVALGEGSAVVAVDHPYTRDWLDHRLRRVVEEALELAAGRALAVEFVLGEEQ